MKTKYLIIVISLFLVGCNPAKNNDTNPKPIWKTDLESYRWIYSGLDKVYKHNNTLIFNTTLVSNEQVEDNRLVGVNMNTGKIEWMYPSDRNQTHNEDFCGGSYLYNNYLIVNSRTYPNEIICINLDTQQDVWRINFGTSTTNGVAGFDDNYAYTYRNDKRYRIDVLTGDTTTITYNAPNIDGYNNYNVGNPFQLYNGNFIHFSQGYNDDYNYNDYVLIQDKQTNKFKTHKIPKFGTTRWGAGGIIVEDKLFIDNPLGAFCFNLEKEQFDWSYKHNPPERGYRMYHHKGVLFKYSHSNMYAFDANTGNILYQSNIGVSWIVGYGDYVYMLDYSSGKRISVINAKSGNLVGTINYPDNDYLGRFNRISPAIYDKKLYLMSYTSAYCYPTYPWN